MEHQEVLGSDQWLPKKSHTKVTKGYKIMHAEGDFLGGPWEALGSPRGAPRAYGEARNLQKSWEE